MTDLGHPDLQSILLGEVANLIANGDSTLIRLPGARCFQYCWHVRINRPVRIGMIADRADVLACRWIVKNRLRRSEALFFRLLAGDDKFNVRKTLAAKARTSRLNKIDNFPGC